MILLEDSYIEVFSFKDVDLIAIVEESISYYALGEL